MALSVVNATPGKINGSVNATPAPLGAPYTPQQYNYTPGGTGGVVGNFSQPTGALGVNTTATTGNGGAATASYDPNLIASYNQAINNAQAAYDTQDNLYNSGLTGLAAQYSDALGALNAGKATANNTYTQNVLSNKQDYGVGKNTIRSNAGNSLNGLLRLLGSRGAGGSSAATITAPGAVAQQATLQQSDLGRTFSKNASGLDQGWQQYIDNYNGQVKSADTQKQNATDALGRSRDTNKASLLQTLAQLAQQKASATGGNPTAASQSYLDQANALLKGASSYTVAPINYQAPTYTAPDLAKYTSNPGITPTFQGQTATSDYTSPYLAALLGKKQQTVTA